MIFKEEGHLYLEGEKSFTSVTTLIKKLEKPKDWDKIAKKYSKEHNIPLEEVKKKWKDEKDKSLIRGTDYHAEKETDINQFGEIVRGNMLCKVKFSPIINGEVTQSTCSLENNTIYTEYMTWDPDSLICGKADEVEVIDGTININDHKTNKEIKKQGFYVRNVGYEKMIGPVSHLDNCNWNHYCIQLSLYMYMLWKHNKHLRIGKLTLNHVVFDQFGNVVDVVQMDVPYLRKEVKDILAWWKTKNQ